MSSTPSKRGGGATLTPSRLARNPGPGTIRKAATPLRAPHMPRDTGPRSRSRDGPPCAANTGSVRPRMHAPVAPGEREDHPRDARGRSPPFSSMGVHQSRHRHDGSVRPAAPRRGSIASTILSAIPAATFEASPLSSSSSTDADPGNQRTGVDDMAHPDKAARRASRCGMAGNTPRSGE